VKNPNKLVRSFHCACEVAADGKKHGYDCGGCVGRARKEEVTKRVADIFRRDLMPQPAGDAGNGRCS